MVEHNLDRFNIILIIINMIKTCLVILVNKLGNTMKQGKLDFFLLLFVEKDMLSKINFNDVIKNNLKY